MAFNQFLNGLSSLHISSCFSPAVNDLKDSFRTCLQRDDKQLVLRQLRAAAVHTKLIKMQSNPVGKCMLFFLLEWISSLDSSLSTEYLPILVDVCNCLDNQNFLHSLSRITIHKCVWKLLETLNSEILSGTESVVSQIPTGHSIPRLLFLFRIVKSDHLYPRSIEPLYFSVAENLERLVSLMPDWMGLPSLKIIFEMSTITSNQDHFRGLLTRNKIHFQSMIKEYVSCWMDGHIDSVFHHNWAIEHKTVMDPEFRTELALLFLPRVNLLENPFELHINRENILQESIDGLKYMGQYVGTELRKDLSVIFEGENGVGIGVTREWFSILCRELVAKHLICDDSAVDQSAYSIKKGIDEGSNGDIHFLGVLVGLALMYHVQLGISFSKVLFLILADSPISLEDIKDDEPAYYNGLVKFLETAPSALASFDIRLESNDPVDESNKMEYVNELIQQKFVISIEAELKAFKKGIDQVLDPGQADTIGIAMHRNMFFQVLELPDFHSVLRGDPELSVDIWKANTEYMSYEASDDQVIWFWECVTEMTIEEKRNLLKFWTSLAVLPLGGFERLRSPLLIAKSTFDQLLPSSNTCMFKLNLPTYNSQDKMRRCLRVIISDFASVSFGII